MHVFHVIPGALIPGMYETLCVWGGVYGVQRLMSYGVPALHQPWMGDWTACLYSFVVKGT